MTTGVKMFPLLLYIVPLCLSIKSKKPSVKNIYIYEPAILISELEKIAEEFEDHLKGSYTQTVIFFTIGTYLLLAGNLTQKLSLTVILSLFIAHYMDLIVNTDTSTWPLSSIFKYIQDLFKQSNNPYVPILIISLVVALIVTFLLSGFRIIFSLAAVYFFFITYVGSVIRIEDASQKYILYGSIVVLFLMIYLIYAKALNVIFILLFSITGSFIVFLSVEKVFDFDLQLSHIFIALKDDYEATRPSLTSILFFVLTLLGTYIQLVFVSPINHL